MRSKMAGSALAVILFLVAAVSIGHAQTACTESYGKGPNKFSLATGSPGRAGAVESTGRGICQETQHHAVLGQGRQRRVHEIAQGQAGGHDHGARAGGREKGRGRRLGDQAGADRVERVLYRRAAGMTRPASRRPRPRPRPIRSSPTASPNFSPAGTTPGPTRRKWMPGRKPISSLPATGTS